MGSTVVGRVGGSLFEDITKKVIVSIHIAMSLASSRHLACFPPPLLVSWEAHP
jgi:hypothetical protein